MRLLSTIPVVLGLVSWAVGQALPLHTSSRWILDAENKRVKFRCVNWAGHMEVNIPEGLHKQSIPWVADWIKNQGFNCVRLTYSIDHALNPNIKVSDAFTAAAGAAGVSIDSMTGLYASALTKNPFLANATTRDVYANIIDELWKRGVMTVLDNHVSKASWCCNLEDGNGWWDSAAGYNDANSRFFHTQDWLAGLQAMASWAVGRKGVVAMSLRNELREIPIVQNADKNDWYNYISQAGKLVHDTNPDVLIVVGGALSATDFTFMRGRPLDTSAWAGKNVWEFHAYSFTVTFPVLFNSCPLLQQEWGLFDGFVLEQGKDYTGPLFLSEFGVGMTGGPNKGLNDKENMYLQCLVKYMSGNDADWAVWAIQGSYYIRDKQVDFDEPYGLLNRDWNNWRNSDFPGMLGSMWQMSQGP